MSLKHSRCITIPLKATHLLSGTLRNLLQDNGQVEIHHAVDEEQVCSTRPCGQVVVGWTRATPKPTPTVTGSAMAKSLGDRLSAKSNHCKVKEWYWTGIRGRLVAQLHNSA